MSQLESFGSLDLGGPFGGMDKLHHALQYLSMSWGIDTPREYMQANMDARVLMINLQNKILNELEAALNAAEN